MMSVKQVRFDDEKTQLFTNLYTAQQEIAELRRQNELLRRENQSLDTSLTDLEDEMDKQQEEMVQLKEKNAVLRRMLSDKLDYEPNRRSTRREKKDDHTILLDIYNDLRNNFASFVNQYVYIMDHGNAADIHSLAVKNMTNKKMVTASYLAFTRTSVYKHGAYCVDSGVAVPISTDTLTECSKVFKLLPYEQCLGVMYVLLFCRNEETVTEYTGRLLVNGVLPKE